MPILRHWSSQRARCRRFAYPVGRRGLWPLAAVTPPLSLASQGMAWTARAASSGAPASSAVTAVGRLDATGGTLLSARSGTLRRMLIKVGKLGPMSTGRVL
jgi:hypothetical protein